MTKEDAFNNRIKALGIKYTAMDYAIPQPWVEKMAQLIPNGEFQSGYERICAQFVWIYDDNSRLFGRPFPLTQDAEDILVQYGDKIK